MPDYLYIHIPFCIRKCLYCDFVSVPYDADLAREYVWALCRELVMRKNELAELKAMYIGGGTPSLLDLRCHEKLFACLRDNAVFLDATETTIEANPATVTTANLKELSALGVNRISLGVQSFQDPELITLGRVHTAQDSRDAIEMVKEAGFGNLSIDLIYGIPGQTQDTWKDTLRQALEYMPQHISTYELTPEEKTPLFSLLQSGNLQLPDDDLVIGMYDTAINTLSAHGYKQYEISNFSLPGFTCRHNLNYWNRGEYVGIGAAAHSFSGNLRTANETDVGKYIATISSGILPIREEIRITPADAARELIFLGLRKRDGITIDEAVRAGIDPINSCGELISEGFLEVQKGRILLTRKGLLIANTVIVKVFERLGL